MSLSLSLSVPLHPFLLWRDISQCTSQQTLRGSQAGLRAKIRGKAPIWPLTPKPLLLVSGPSVRTLVTANPGQL